MQARVTDRPVEQVIAAIQALDLDPIKLKLMDPEEGQGWSREYVDRMELTYKRFLTLLATHPEETLAPTKDVDKFWHGHILDTLKYAEDCDKVFGYFLHHFPYFGMRGEEDAANLARAAEKTRHLYAQDFGDAQTSVAFCGAAKQDAAFCGAKESAVFCGAARESAAFCGAAKHEAAFCGAAKENAAFCGAAKQNTAFCGAAKESVVFCGAARLSDKLRVSERPALPTA